VFLLVISLASYNTKRAFVIFLAIITSVIILLVILSLGFFLFATECYISLSCIMLARAI
jgi:hypothetical protein